MANGTLRKWGNSQGVLIPKGLCDRLGIKTGDAISLTIDGDSIVLKPEREHTLSALMAGYAGPMPEEVDWGAPAGKELW